MPSVARAASEKFQEAIAIAPTFGAPMVEYCRTLEAQALDAFAAASAGADGEGLAGDDANTAARLHAEADLWLDRAAKCDDVDKIAGKCCYGDDNTHTSPTSNMRHTVSGSDAHARQLACRPQPRAGTRGVSGGQVVW